MPKKKIVRFEEQQNQTINKLFEILNLNEEKIFLLYDLDNDQEKIDKLNELGNDVKKYYSSCTCRGVTNEICKRPYLSIIRFLLKNHNYSLYSMDHAINLGNKEYIRTKKYKIIW